MFSPVWLRVKKEQTGVILAEFSDIAGFDEFIEALEAVGIDSNGVDPGVAALSGLSMLNRFLGDGSAITEYDAQQVAALRQSVDQFVGDQFVTLRAISERDYDALGLNDATLNPFADDFDVSNLTGDAFTRLMIETGFNRLSAVEAIPGILREVAEQQGFTDLLPLIDRLPSNFMDDIPAALDLLENSVRGENGALSYFDIVEKMAQRGAFDNIDPPQVSQIVGPDVTPVIEEEVEESLPPVSLAEQSQAALRVENKLRFLILIAQSGLDEKRAGAESWIYGLPESDMLIQGATEFLESGQGTPEERKQAQDYLDNVGGFETNDAINMIDMLKLGSFENDWFTGVLEKLPQAVKDNVNNGFAKFHDLPDVDDLNLNDGILDQQDQYALQGVLVLMGQKLGVHVRGDTYYTPELGARFVQKIDELNLDQVQGLLDGELLAMFDALPNDEAKVVFLEMQKTEMKQFFADLDTLDRANALVHKNLYLSEDIKIPDVTRDIFAEYVGAEGRTPEQIALLNNLTHAFTDGFDLHTVLGGESEFKDLIRPLDPEKDARTRFKELYENGIDQDELAYMLFMLDALPYGGQARRDGVKEIFSNAKLAVENAAEDDDLSAIWADAIISGFEALNSNPETHSNFVFGDDRIPFVDPRRHDFSIVSEGATFDENDVFDLLKAKNDNWKVNHEPLYFSDDTGTQYVAVMDVESHMILIEELDLEGWETAVNSTPRREGESVFVHGNRLHDALSEVSGYDLIFQQRGGRMRATHSDNRVGFHQDMAGSISSLNAQAGSIMNAQSRREAEREAELAAEQAERARPRGVQEELALGDEFTNSAAGGTDDISFADNALDITSPPVGAPTVPVPNTPDNTLRVQSGH